MGPLLLVMGAPMGAAAFAPLADVLAVDHTVVTHDPRGISASRLDDPDQDSTPELRADDAVALLDGLGAESADVFGSSGGAVTGLAMVTRHPGRVRTLVAHEPPLLELLPDAAERRAGVDDMVESFHREGLAAALTATATRVLIGIGVGSRGLVTYQTSMALADALGTPPVEFPGDHGGFVADPAKFADVLRHVLTRDAA
jgi:pimeloyl-ACP methyl ester carboxylesterase